MEITDDILQRSLMNATKNGTGSHYIAKCPYCDRDDHLYVQRKTDKKNSRGENVSYMWECKLCGENGRIKKLFYKLGLLHLLMFGNTVQIDESLTKKIVKYKRDIELDADLSVDKKTPPLGWKRLYCDPYLKSRGIVDDQLKVYHVGRTQLLHKLKSYVVMLILEDGECRGYVARSERSKEWIDIQNKAYKKQGLRKKYLRYQNSPNTDFGKLLMGIDEIDEGTRTVIVVEGPFDKTNIDKLMELWKMSEIKCVCSFGKKLSDVQIKKLHRKGIDDVVLLYDPDAVDASKRYAFELTRQFNRVRVGFTSQCDPGDLNFAELAVILTTLESPVDFTINKVQKKL